MINRLLSVAAITLATATYSTASYAVLADDVVCTYCIQTGDLGGGSVSPAKLKPSAVTTPKIKDSAVTAAKIRGNAVTTAKIKDGAVTEAKLDATVQAKLNAVGGLPTFDMPGPVTVTEQIFNLQGDFTTGSSGPAICQSAGADTERRTIVRSSITGGTQIDITRERFNGGTGGTNCHYNKIVMNNVNGELWLVKREKYNTGGTAGSTLKFTDEFDQTCSDCGLRLRFNGMSDGLVTVSGDMLKEIDNVNANAVLGETIAFASLALVEPNGDETINEGSGAAAAGTGGEEILTGCNGYMEDRSTDYMGTFKRVTKICPTVGRVFEARRNPNGTSQMWFLNTYTTTAPL